MGLISPGGENLLDFLELGHMLSSYDGDLRDPLWWAQERPVPMLVARGPLGIPLPSMPGPKTLCGVGACRGPPPVDPGNSKGRQRWLGKTCLFINVRLD